MHITFFTRVDFTQKMYFIKLLLTTAGDLNHIDYHNLYLNQV